MADAVNAGIRYKDKVTIVTGGGRGIGKGIVSVFVRHGSKVVIAEIDESLGADAEKAANGSGPGEAMFVQCDVTKESDVKGMVAKTIERYGRIDCLINNAGTALTGSMDIFPIENVRKLNDLNILGPFIVSKYCLPHLRQVKGNIINMASISGLIGQQSAVSYCITKAASVGFTKALASEEAKHGVRVNGIAPGPIQTELLETFMQSHKDPEKAKEYYQHQCIAMGRMGLPEEIGMACLYFAADATFCTGSIQVCSGGAELDYGVKRGMEHILELKSP